MTHPLGYYYYVRDGIDGALPAPRRPAASQPTPPRRVPPRRPTRDHRRELGLCLFVAATALPVLVASALLIALNLLS